MKVFTKVLLYIICATLLISCSKQAGVNSKFTPEQVASLGLDSTKMIQIQTDSIIDIDLNPFLKEDVLEIGRMLKSIRFLPLETTDKCLISEIGDILITESNVYISDTYKGGSLLIFDKNGKFLKRITRGQGPEEVLELKSFAYDNDKQELVIFHYNMLSFYTSAGQFIRKEILPLFALEIAVISNGYLFRNMFKIDNRHLGYSRDYQVFITNKNFRVESIGIPYLYSKENYYEAKKYISTYKDNINLTFKFCDTIYQYLDNNTLRAKYALNFRDKKVPDRAIRELPTMDFMNVLKNNNYFLFMGEYIENDTNDFFRLVNWHLGLKTDIFRNKKSGNLLGGTTLITNVSDFPYTNVPVTSYESYFVSYFLPEKMDILKEIIKQSELLSDEDRSTLENVEDDDNPVLVFYELKDF